MKFVCCNRTLPDGRTVAYCMPVPRDAQIVDRPIAIPEGYDDCESVMVQIPLRMLMRLFPSIVERHAQQAAVA